LAILQPPAGLTARLTRDRDSVYQYVAGRFSKDYSLTWLEPIGFNNAYALMMRRSQTQQLGIHTITDLTNYLKK
jgi:osmoprotectant transport system permease protein